ncbi:MAG: hypothetical protein ACJAT2_003317 [Bacteriovoracaceae bacterium]|jgi:hypothetical protein
MSKLFLDYNFQETIIERTSSQLESYWDSPEALEHLGYYKKRFSIDPVTLIAKIKDQSHKPISVFITQFFINTSYLRDLIDEEDTDDLLEFWEASEFTSLFFDSNEIEEGEFLSKSKTCLKKLESVWVTYLYIHLEISIEAKLCFKPIPEIGDFDNTYYTENGYSLNLQEIDQKYSCDEIINELEEHNFHKELPVEQVITIEEFGLGFRAGSSLSKEEYKTAADKLEISLKTLAELTPELFKTLTQFTHTVIAINVPEMVSFSLQSLPGYSSINLFHRDKVDCLDDLLHENGHHFLNTILNHSELIVEDPEKDYPSPWRMSFRPIRGIYHGVFTFYWALELFGQLAKSTQLEDRFSKEEVSKIKIRYIEEYYRLIYCEESLDMARENELITDEGWDLIQKILIEIKDHLDSVKVIEESLSKDEIKEIASIKSSLKSLKETAFH